MMKREAIVGQYDFSTTALGFGTAGIFREPAKSARRNLLESAIGEGILHFDTAPMYGLGLAQGELGQVLRGKREKVVIVTKVGIGLTPIAKTLGRIQGPARRILQRRPALQQSARQSAASSSSGRLGALLYKSTFDSAFAKKSLDESLRELGTEYIDLLLLHDPEPSRINPSEIYELLENARASGKILSWGVAGEANQISSVINMLPGPTPVVQIRDDIFRRDDCVSLPLGSDFLITYGVLGDALARILTYTTATEDRAREWTDSVGEDCTDPSAVAILLLKDALRSNSRGTVLYSTSRPAHMRDAADLMRSDPAAADESLNVFRHLVRTQLGTSEIEPKDEQ